jgi:Zn-finger nucleic acid-binding protein
MNTVIATNVASRSDQAPYRQPAKVSPEPTPSAELVERSPGRGCPRCRASLEAGIAEDLDVLRCPRCSGEFVEHAILRAMIEACVPEGAAGDGQAAPRPAQQRPELSERGVHYLRCPMCDEVMSRMNFGKRSGIIVDACKPHGTWFDQGELLGTLAFVRAGGLAVEGAERGERHGDMGEAAKMAKVMNSMLETERLQQAQAVADATDFVDDLLFILSPGDRHWAWGRIRGR